MPRIFRWCTLWRILFTIHQKLLNESRFSWPCVFFHEIRQQTKHHFTRYVLVFFSARTESNLSYCDFTRFVESKQESEPLLIVLFSLQIVLAWIWFHTDLHWGLLFLRKHRFLTEIGTDSKPFFFHRRETCFKFNAIMEKIFQTTRTKSLSVCCAQLRWG